MKIEKLRKNHKKEIIIGAVLLVVIGGALTFKLTHSKYRVTQSIDLGSGVINYKEPDFKIMAMYKNDGSGDVSIDSMPTSGYVINTSKSVCNVDNVKDSNITIEYNNGKVNFLGVSKKGTKCYLYFDKINGITIDNIIATIKASSSYKGTTTPTFSTKAEGAETEANNGIYATADGTNMYGTNTTTYYWRGAATTNHVIFANKCWRIVRINGDKTMRLIYNGTVQSGNTCFGNGENANSIAVSSQKYNSSANQSNYVGWTYDGNLQRTLSGTSSNAKIQTEIWYNSNIGNNTTYSSKVADGKFCNDRNAKSGQSWVSTGTAFQYAGYTRLSESYSPTLNCPSGDAYTLKIGAITADEVMYAGARADNTSYYLYNGQYYWTMSPYSWGGDRDSAHMFIVYSNGFLGNWALHSTSPGLRPVINLKADTTFARDSLGTQNSPYIVQ